MNPSAQEEESLSARSNGLQEIRGEGGADTGPWLRLRAAMVAAAVVTLFILGTGAAQFGQAQAESVLYNFTDGSDGGQPQAGLIMDSSHNLYGTSYYGGDKTYCPDGCGTVFEMVYDSSTNSYTEQVLYWFEGSTGALPTGKLVMDSSGNLYGTTQ